MSIAQLRASSTIKQRRTSVTLALHAFQSASDQLRSDYNAATISWIGRWAEQDLEQVAIIEERLAALKSALQQAKG